MQNVAIIEIDSPPFWQNGDTIYPPTIPTNQQLEFACELCRTLGAHLEKVCLKCGSAYHHFQLGGGEFCAVKGKKRFWISISLERKPASKTKVTVWAEPHIPFLSVIYPPINNIWVRWNKNVWNEFGLHLHKAVELQFQGCPLKWMTEEEWFAENPEWHFGD